MVAITSTINKWIGLITLGLGVYFVIRNKDTIMGLIGTGRDLMDMGGSLIREMVI